jgi:phage I-like protein
MSLDPHNPTLHLASELAVGWVVLHLGATGNNHAVTAVLDADPVVVQVDDGSTHGWDPEDRVHALTPDELAALTQAGAAEPEPP